MTFRTNMLAGCVVLALSGGMPLDMANASTNSQFRAAISKMLYSIRPQQQALADMSNREFRAFVRCAQNVMDSAPAARKRYVLAARNTRERRRRFDEVALDNRAALKQRITRECYF